MPNWCDNTLYMTHKDPKMMDKAIDGWKNNKFLATLVPEPDYTQVKVKHTFPTNMATGEAKPEFVDPDQAWWDWRLQNWGTKWEICSDDSYIDIQENEQGKSIRASFSSAWSPPTEAYAKLCEMGFEIRAMYYEGGCCFCGVWENGRDESYDIKGNSKWVKKNIPSEIDEEFCISWNMAEWEDEEENAETEES